AERKKAVPGHDCSNGCTEASKPRRAESSALTSPPRMFGRTRSFCLNKPISRCRSRIAKLPPQPAGTILTIVTGNDGDFRRPGLKVFNPFKELASIGSLGGRRHVGSLQTIGIRTRPGS